MAKNYLFSALLGTALLCAAQVSLTAGPVAREPALRPLALLFDDYYQLVRPYVFSQGAPRKAEDRKLTNAYSPEANGIPNGTFVFSRLIAPDYKLTVSHAPITAELLATTDAYMMVCPVPHVEGRSGITEKEADLLESFVARGGILILVFNSVTPNDRTFDLPGFNLIAERFHLHFAEKTTSTLLIPISRDNPIFSGPQNYIYGNGTIIETDKVPTAGTTVVLESCNPEVPGPVVVRVRYKQGTVLALGDAGSLGNAHSLRSETDQAEALRQLMHSLLPDGPLPSYGWRPGLRMKVKLSHQQVITGYPHELRLLDLPLDPKVKFVESGMRALDKQSAVAGAPVQPAGAERGFATVTAELNTNATLSIGKFDGRAFAASWDDEQGKPITCRITPRGEVLDSGIEASALTVWRWALTNAAIVSPLDPVARVGNEWTRTVLTPLPHAQLPSAPRLREAKATLRLEGTEECNGHSCFVVSQSVDLSPLQMKPEELIDPAYADYFNQRNITFSSSGQMVYVKSWVDQTTRLPVKTELRTSSAFWWEDHDQPDFFLSGHDAKRIYEDVKSVRHVVTFGRLFTAEFDAP